MTAATASAEVSVPSLFTDHMVLQRDLENPVWGKAAPGEEVTVEIASANFPEIRLLTIPLIGRQEAQDDFDGQWEICSPETVSGFSAVGYFFGRRLHNTLGVPVGMIQTLRDKWSQGDFPFYWVQLADFQSESAEPQDHSWAHLRESQTKTLDALPNTGQAVIIDAGEGRDIHPRDKQTVAHRLALIALARDYGYDMSYQSPRFTEMATDKGQVRLSFSPVSGGGLYAWGINPVCNLYDRNGLPVTPFRTDDW